MVMRRSPPSQCFLLATPVFVWFLAFYTHRFIPSNLRPAVQIVLPTLETVLYISDILARFTHLILVIHSVIHYTYPLVLSLFLWLFRPSKHGYMNPIAVLVQILIPCTATWYEVIYGHTPATYDIPGSGDCVGA